ncbi:hypothetical protein ACFQ1I_19290 [Kitasatospora arboriphila]
MHTGAPVLLHALDLPELLVAGEPGDLYEEPDHHRGDRLAEPVAALADRVPRHPRLLVETGAAAEGDLLWVAAERVAGAPLDELADTGPVPPYRVAELAADLAGALRALHGAGLVHGNVTAGAVLVCEDGAALLGGLLLGAAQEAVCAQLAGPVPRRRYEARADLLGPLAERWPADAGPPGDCWALGVLLYRLLTGHGPYPEDDLPTLLAAVRDGQRYPADGCGPLRSLVEELLDLGPAARPTAEDVQRRVRALLAARPSRSAPARRRRRCCRWCGTARWCRTRAGGGTAADTCRCPAAPPGCLPRCSARCWSAGCCWRWSRPSPRSSWRRADRAGRAAVHSGPRRNPARCG